MNKKLLVINAVGLTQNLIEKYSYHTLNFTKQNQLSYLTPPFPAVTCTSQTNMLTGKEPKDHGIVANGWLFRDLTQIWLWRQSDALVQKERIWDTIRKRIPSFTVANMFWWYNMYSSANFSVTPRPIYRSDGIKLPNVYSYPPELTSQLQQKYGTFPLFNFWGPMASIKSTRWITDTMIEIMKKNTPHLCLAYLPHLDYCLQKYGPQNPIIAKDVQELDTCIQDLLITAKELGYETIIVSEYGIQDVHNPIHINRELQKHGLIQATKECNEEHPDVGACRAFALADHQIAHIYIKNPADVSTVKKIVSSLKGVAKVLDRKEQEEIQINHERSGELVALAEKDSWFTYYYWSDDRYAPDFARTVDIHKKPGYDPVELFMCPNGKIKALKALLKKKLGFRYLLDVIPLDATLIKGSHGVPTESPKDGPLVIGHKEFISEHTVQPMTEIFHIINRYFQ